MTSYASLPELAFGAAVPGKIAFEDGLPGWSGLEAWHVKHGAAATEWLLGHVHKANDVLLPTGARSSEVLKGAPGDGRWRFRDEDGAWTYGALDLREDDVVFLVQEQPAKRRWQTGSLPWQLCNSVDACARVADMSFAEDLYATLTSGLWKLAGSGKDFVGSWRRCAEVVVSMRGLNEPYDVMFDGGCEGFITPETNDLLTTMGWEFMGALESHEERHAKALKIVDVCESRQVRDVPEWYPKWYKAFSVDDPDPSSRLNVAAFLGQVEVQDWETFWQNFNLDAEY